MIKIDLQAAIEDWIDLLLGGMNRPGCRGRL
jgi:hypothetical protein